MRTSDELKSKEFNDDMRELDRLLTEKGIEHEFKRHAGADPELLVLIGYYPTGEWHIKIGEVSVIRGMASFGDYEAYGGKYKEPERFATAEELVESLIQTNNE